MKTDKLKLEKTRKRSLPAFWEKGGGYSNTGDAVIIASRGGRAKTPVYIRRRGPLACSEHALFVIEEGDYVIRANHHRLDYRIWIYQVRKIEKEEGNDYIAHVSLVCSYDEGEWDSNLPEFLLAAVEAAKEKARCYHCREPHYVNGNTP